MIKISPSILAADFAALGADVARVEKAGASMLHLDVMDGAFVPNISFGAPVIASIRPHTKLKFDVHLMINDPARYLDDFIAAGADSITFHYESCKDHAGLISRIKAHNLGASLSISPATPYEVLLPFIDKLDMVLVMTVEPGFGGQKMMPATLEKVRALRNYAISHGLNFDIEVDGGITPANVGLVTAAGANVIVAGSSIFRADDPSAAIAQMNAEAEKNPFRPIA